MDSITAEDIGKLPDVTIADTLQRIPGIQTSLGGGRFNHQCSRYAASDNAVKWRTVFKCGFNYHFTT